MIPHGVIANSVKMKGLVETSLNPGILNVSAVEGMVSTSVRSSNAAAKEALINQLKSLAALCDATVGIRGDYPGWDYDPDSPLREKMVTIYEEMYGVKPFMQDWNVEFSKAKFRDLTVFPSARICRTSIPQEKP